jgi:bacteriocin biosynthesis cyclodehydratase domain-containing protein
MRPILRPGTHVLRRDGHELQVGLDPLRAVILPDHPDVRGCLERLGRAAEVGEYDGPATGDDAAPSTLELLTGNDLVLDGNALMPLLPTRDADQGSHSPRRRGPGRPAVAALARSDGDEARALLEARTRTRATVVSFGNGLGADLADELPELLLRAGLRVTRTGGHDVIALVGVGEPHRELADGWMRAGTPHLVVRATEGCMTVGPFVVPGETACLRCIDGHHADADPSWPLLVEQYASLTGRERADGVPEPVDGMVARVALAWAARDLTSYAEGRRPSTWSATIRFDAHLTAVEARAWLRHPECGCCWQ